MPVYWVAVASVLAILQGNVLLVASQARPCFFGPLSPPDPNDKNPVHWMQHAVDMIRKNCPGQPRRAVTTQVTCPPLAVPVKGSVTNCTLDGRIKAVATDNQPVGTRCDMACDYGYLMSGTASRYCLATGNWSGVPTECPVPCPSLSAPDYGMVAGCVKDGNSSLGADKHPSGTVCAIACHHGYAPSSDHTLTCLSNGTWDRDGPQCAEITCSLDDLRPPANSVMTGCTAQEEAYGSQCTLTWSTGANGAPTDESSCQINVGLQNGETAGTIACRNGWVIYKHVGLNDADIIPDSWFTSSSSDVDTLPRMARLHGPDAWSPSVHYESSWIEVDLQTDTEVNGLWTQGSNYDDTASRVTLYRVSYKTSNVMNYKYVRNSEGAIGNFSGNVESGLSPVLQVFEESIWAAIVRIQPLQWYRRPKLRLEFLGCRLN